MAQWIPLWGEEGKVELEKVHARLVERFGQERADRIDPVVQRRLVEHMQMAQRMGAINCIVVQEDGGKEDKEKVLLTQLRLKCCTTHTTS